MPNKKESNSIWKRTRPIGARLGRRFTNLSSANKAITRFRKAFPNTYVRSPIYFPKPSGARRNKKRKS